MKGIEGLTLGRYELRQRLAQGGMAEVYLAFDRRVRRQVAIKVLYARDEAFIRRFEREALAVGTLSHDHILPLYDYGEQSPWYYLVMPYVEGGTLRDYLQKRKQLTLEEAASIIDQIASALQYAHDSGVIHRDVKPSNILLRPDGYAYLVDFGLAKALTDAESLTNDGAMVGTPEYMAPEQSNGLSDYRSDIYSLGVILYQMLTGRVPFTAETPVAISLKHIQTTAISPRTLNSAIPESIEAIILKALAKDPNDRYQQAQSFSTAYWKALQHEQLCTKLNLKPASRKIELSSETPETPHETEEPKPHAPIATQVLEETEEEPSHPPITPLLLPLQAELETASLPPIATTPTRKIRMRSIILALALLIPLILALPLGLLWQTQHKIEPLQSVQKVNALQQGQPNLTATAQAHLQATLAAQSRVLATAGITSSIGTGTILYDDDMLSSGGGWINDGSQCYFSPDGYHVRLYAPYKAAWCYSNQQQYSNVVITAQAQLIRGDIYGLIFRLSPASHEFYVLEINSQGDYRFVRAWGNNPLNWLTLIDWTHSNAILSGYGQINTFLIQASGSQFSFYVNKQLIVNGFVDGVYTSGLIGFLVGGDSAGGAEGVFSNVLVFQK